MSTSERAAQPEEPAAGRLRLTLSPDLLAAYLQVVAPPNDVDVPLPTLEEALVWLANANVCVGLDRQRVAQAIEAPGEPILVAEGQPPCDGEDGLVEYAPCLLAVGGRPHVGPDGRVDLFDLDLLHNVAAGVLLASRTPPRGGEPGVTVLGQVISGRPGRPARLSAGSGARFTDDGLNIIATTAGHATLVGDTVMVSPIYRVRGDVGPATGHIDFVGNVSISGNVDPGFHVKAEGDVEIQGTMAAGDVQAGGNVSVRYGIQGHNGHGRVAAAGSVRAKFIQSAEVRAGESVYASDGIVQSTVEAGAKVEVLGSHGAIVGGHVLARQAVSARDIGSPGGIATEIVVGVDPTVFAELKEIKARVSQFLPELEQIQQRLAFLQGQERLTAVGRAELQKFHTAYRSLLEERAHLGTRHKELQDLLLALRGAVVAAQGTCHTDVRITIGTSTLLVREAWEGIRFQRNEQLGEIESVSLSG